MATIVNPHIWERIPELHSAYRGANPFPHFVVENFLDETFARQLLAEFPTFDEARAKDENGRVGRKAAREDLPRLSPSYAALDKIFSSRQFLDWMSYVTEIPNLIYDPAYVGGGTHENLTGQDMSVHVDFNYHPHEGWHRRINALLYLNPEWEESWGGALELWKNPWDQPAKNQIRKLAPVWNRLVVFATSEESWHGFEKVMIPEGAPVGSRKSIAIYLYSKERPKHETRAMHSTIYYERPLPETIAAGKVLSQKEWDEVQRLTVRRDELLKMLYRREGQFSVVTDELRAAVSDLELGNDFLRERVGDLTKWSGGLGDRLADLRRVRAAWHEALLHNSGKVQLDAIGANRFMVRAGAALQPFVGPDARVEAVIAEPKAGDWILAQFDRGSLYELVRVVEKIRDCHLCWEPASGNTLLVPPRAFQGVVKQAQDEFGLPIELDLPMPEVPARAIRVARWFLALNQAKNLLLGRIRSPLLWKLSQMYRNALAGFGVAVPVLLPSEERERRHG